jgi:hypothetical protein
MLSSSISKWSFVKNLIYHIVMVIAQKQFICVMIIIKLLDDPQTYSNHMKSYILTSHHMKLKNVVSLVCDFFEFWPTIICKSIMKNFHNNGMVEV